MSLLVMSPCYCPTAEPAQGLVATAKKVGIEVLLYGVGKVIATNCSNAQGTDMLALMEQRSEKYIMCVDSMDVALLADAEEIMTKFEALDTGLVVSTEREGIAGLPKTKTKLHQMCLAEGGYHPQLNMGGWLGDRQYALHAFREAERLWRHRPEDPTYNYDVLPQWLMQMKAGIGLNGERLGTVDRGVRCWEGPEFALDWHCSIFQSMNQTFDVLHWEGKRVFNRVTGTKPCVIHYNGDKTYGAYHERVRWLLEG